MKRGLLFIASVIMTAAFGFGQQTREDRIIASLAEKLRAAKIESGMIVTSVGKGAGDRLGLRDGDLIVKINDRIIVDTGEFANVRMQHRGIPEAFTIWRDGAYVTLPETVLPAALNISGADWSYSMAQLIFRLEAGDQDTAVTFVQQAEADHLLSAKNLLIAKLLILPGGPPTPNSEQERLTSQLADLLSPNECIASATLLQTHGRGWSAVPLQRKLVASQPENVSHRLNFALLLATLKLNEEALQNVNYILDRPKANLSKYGLSVAEDIFSITAANNGNWKEAFAHHQRLLDYRTEFETPARALRDAIQHLYLASRLDDLEVFKLARLRATDIVGSQTIEWSAYGDALEAFLLFRAARETEARQLAAKWANKPEWQMAYDLWLRIYPECARNWKVLGQ